MIVRSEHTRLATTEISGPRKDQGDALIVELGGDPAVRDMRVSEDGLTTIIDRLWSSLESAESWCQYVLSKEGTISAECIIVEA
jgi:hypothetical protein